MPTKIIDARTLRRKTQRREGKRQGQSVRSLLWRCTLTTVHVGSSDSGHKTNNEWSRGNGGLQIIVCNNEQYNP